jgi:hypothetical protein
LLLRIAFWAIFKGR